MDISQGAPWTIGGCGHKAGAVGSLDVTFEDSGLSGAVIEGLAKSSPSGLLVTVDGLENKEKFT